MSMFDDPRAPKMTTEGLMSGARDMSNAGMGPKIGPAPSSPWAPQGPAPGAPPRPTLMQQQQGGGLGGGGLWPSWLSPAAAPAAAPELQQAPAGAGGAGPAWLAPQAPPAPAAAPSGPNMGIPGAQQTAAGGAPSWIMQMLFGGY
jgi:hypothetical protein